MPEINWHIMASQVMTFLIALAIVWKVSWKPLTKFIHDRQERIRKTLDDAENTRQEIAKLEADYRVKLEQVEQKSSEIIAAARQDAGRARDEILRAAQADALEVRKKAQEQLEQDRRQIMAAMRSEIVGLSMAIAEKALQERIPEVVQERKFQDILKGLKGTSQSS
jgi:F-type H+-transporting ATPase subunit b